MATIDEILDAMPEEDAATGRDYLVIDPETRTITVPSTEKVFGVEGDEDAARKYFICPRYVGDNLDLASMFLTVYWRNANGDADGYLVEDVQITGDYVTFSWLLSEKSVAYKGVLQFSVCADLPNTPNKRRPDWNTTTATGEVLEGQHPDLGDVEGETSDVVTQLRAEIAASTAAVEATGAAQVQNVKNEGSAQVNTVKATGAQTETDALAAIKAQGEATLATIPADYTALAAKVDKLTRDRAAAIVCQAEGELLQITDAGNDPLQGLRIFGKTKQQKTTGAQLLAFPYPSSTKTAHGVTFTVQPDGAIKLSGQNYATDDVSCYFTLWAGALTPGQYAYKCYDLPSNCLTNIYYIGNVAAGAAQTFTANEGVEYTIVIRVKAGAVLNATIRPMLNTGDTVLDWEPYSAGKVAPCPDYPQELASLPAPAVSVYGRNLLDGTKLAVHPEYTELYSSTLSTTKYRVEKGLTYTLSFDTENTGKLMYINPVSGFNYTQFTMDGKRHSFTKTMAETYETDGTNLALVSVCDTTDVECGSISNVQLELGDVAHEYEPYKRGVVTITTPGSLPGIPVASGGNYTDAAGQEWVCDEVDLARGVYVQRIKTMQLPSTFVVNETTNEMWIQLPDSEAAGYNTSGQQCICTHFPGTSRQEVYDRAFEEGYRGIAARDRFVRIVDNVTFNADPDALNAWIDEQTAAGAAVIVSYILNKPVEKALTDAELQAYLAMRSYKPTTTVLNDAGAHMALEYAADPKTYIDNKLAALIAANN